MKKTYETPEAEVLMFLQEEDISDLSEDIGGNNGDLSASIDGEEW